MTSDLALSIVIPTHQRSALLRRAVASVLASPRADITALVVEDNATSAPEALREWADDERLAESIYHREHQRATGSSHELAMDLQERPPQCGHRRHHTRYETGPKGSAERQNGRVSSTDALPKMGEYPHAPRFRAMSGRLPHIRSRAREWFWAHGSHTQDTWVSAVLSGGQTGESLAQRRIPL